MMIGGFAKTSSLMAAEFSKPNTRSGGGPQVSLSVEPSANSSVICMARQVGTRGTMDEGARNYSVARDSLEWLSAHAGADPDLSPPIEAFRSPSLSLRSPIVPGTNDRLINLKRMVRPS